LKVIEENLGNTTIVIQTVDEPLEVFEDGGRATHLTGIRSSIENGYTKIKSLIKEIATDIGDELHTIESSSRPKQVEMEFQIALSAQIGPVLILSGKGDCAMKVKMTWDLTSNGKTTS
jgi:hypothetical protein